ncbi:MAG: ATP-binding protein [Chloroflexi bacterium]|nr:ATP-binding protein [Chloroflexota bacterium]
MPSIPASMLAALEMPDLQWRQPVVIALMGLPCTGKTSTARTLARRHPLVHLSVDAIRRDYAVRSEPAALDIVYQVAAEILKQHGGVILDGMHATRSDRHEAQKFAEKYGAHFILIHTVAPTRTVAERLWARMEQPDLTAAEGNAVMTHGQFREVARSMELPGPDESAWTIDTSQGRIDGQIALLEQQLAMMITF